ncbi:MAG: hypothetical protein ABUL61_05310 [Oleiharenicola lentus]
MDIKDAQRNMRHGYYGGAPGLAASALMWLLAGAVSAIHSSRAGVLALIFGGTLIHPLAILGSKLLRRPGTHARDNPFGALALEGTVILMFGVLLAFALSQFREELFFPAMLLVIGGRYLTFQTLYGLPVYWVCGGVLAALGLLAAILKFPAAASAFAGGVTEAVFAVVVFSQVRGEGQGAGP